MARKIGTRLLLAATISLALILDVEDSDAQIKEAGPIDRSYQWNLPAWLEPPPDPANNPVTGAKVELGRRLFYDGRLAADGLRSCASCHKQDRAFSDDLPLSWGVTGALTSRNTPGLSNVGYFAALTWRDPRVTSLEVQALGPLFGLHPIEMGMAGLQAEIVRLISEDPIYRELFPVAFPESPNPYLIDKLTMAIAAFERTLISARSPYDHFRFGGESDAISASAKRGEALFFSSRLACSTCHSGMHFTDAAIGGPAPTGSAPYHNTGLYNVDGAGSYPASNPGLISVTASPSDMGRFRTPSLRNVEVSGPYMHDGTIATLEGVIDFYAAGGRTIPARTMNAGDGRKSPVRDTRIAGFSLTRDEKIDLLSFLRALTDEAFLSDPRLSNPWDRPLGATTVASDALR